MASTGVHSAAYPMRRWQSTESLGGRQLRLTVRVMTEPIQDKSEVDQFILGHIESVPHLEALLLGLEEQTQDVDG